MLKTLTSELEVWKTIKLEMVRIWDGAIAPHAAMST